MLTFGDLAETSWNWELCFPWWQVYAIGGTDSGVAALDWGRACSTRA